LSFAAVAAATPEKSAETGRDPADLKDFA